MPDRHLVPLSKPNACPIDGQTLEWHVKILGHNEGGIIFFGDRLGCGYISPLDRTNYTPKEQGWPTQRTATTSEEQKDGTQPR